MAIEFEIEGRLVRARASKAGTEIELADAMARATSTPAFVPGAVVLIDVRRIDETPTSSMLSETGRFFGREGAKHFSRVALVASGPMQFGLSRMFGAFTEHGGLEVRVFDDEEKALLWLDP